MCEDAMYVLIYILLSNNTNIEGSPQFQFVYF